jgi:ABC-type multidrug transport system fused ATPase/permease subunit
MLETICFQALPNLIDLVVAFIYLSIMFGPYEGFITISTSVLFLYISTTVIARMRSARETEISAYFEEHYVLQSGISGWSTVSSFNQVHYEENRYSLAIQDRIAKQKVVWIGYMTAHAFQYLVLLAGLLAGLFLAVYQVTHGIIRPGAFLTLLTYWSQMMSPLNFFAGLGRSISRNLLQAERLLDIMQTKSSIVNKPDAPPFQFKAGSVEFHNVKFSYDNKKQVLKKIDFSVQPGTTIAFVGQTGAGKSTILKLLDRFYDVTEGCIKIDDQDIREVDLHSLRAHIGVVPQNPSLFNDTIMNNVRYAKLEATDEEVFEACRAAAIHEQILGFSEGYNTRVGERGMKLSGGELQRVAIARAILRQPKIVLLDEATSAIDTETEFLIQQALRRLCKNRTTFIVAHRLSTIVNADRIVVVTNGEILEQGNHETLIAAGGKYADLWSKQVRSFNLFPFRNEQVQY